MQSKSIKEAVAHDTTDDSYRTAQEDSDLMIIDVHKTPTNFNRSEITNNIYFSHDCSFPGRIQEKNSAINNPLTSQLASNQMSFVSSRQANNINTHFNKNLNYNNERNYNYINIHKNETSEKFEKRKENIDGSNNLILKNTAQTQESQIEEKDYAYMRNIFFYPL